MSRRLQVLLEDAELRELPRAARAGRMTVAEWVRQALRDVEGLQKFCTAPGLSQFRWTERH